MQRRQFPLAASGLAMALSLPAQLRTVGARTSRGGDGGQKSGPIWWAGTRANPCPLSPG